MSETSSNGTNQPFPAARIGIIAGVSAAVTLVVLAAVLFAGRLLLGAVEASREDAAAQAEYLKSQVVSDDFRAKLVDYVGAVKASREAAHGNFAHYKAASAKVESDRIAMEEAVKSKKEISLISEVEASQGVYDVCVQGALGPEFRSGKVSDCDTYYPAPKFSDIEAEAGVK